jgi:HEAT repeat protein
LEAALRDLEHSKIDVRLSAVRDLARLARAEQRIAAVSALVHVLRSDRAPRARAEAAVVLADVEARDALGDLISAARDDDPYVRQMSIIAVGELADPGDAAALSVVENALASDAPALRYQALIALGRLAPGRFERAISDIFDDPDEQVRYVAIRLIEERWLNESQELPSAVRRSIEATSDDDSPAVRLAGAILLTRSGDASRTGEIVAALNALRPIRDPEDEQAAIELAGELRLVAAQRGLSRRAFGVFGVSRDPFAWHARVALARLGDARAIASIQRGLLAWTRDARTLAVAAAGQARLFEARNTILAMRGDERRADPEAIEQALELLGEAE